MKQILYDHFAVCIVLLVFAALFGAYMLEIHWGRAPSTLDWLEGEMKEVIGAILMGLTGKAGVAVVGGTRKTDTAPPAEVKP